MPAELALIARQSQLTKFVGAVFGISLLVRDLQGISRNSSRIRQFTPEISIQFQGDIEEFPKRVNRERLTVNRKTKLVNGEPFDSFHSLRAGS